MSMGTSSVTRHCQVPGVEWNPHGVQDNWWAEEGGLAMEKQSVGGLKELGLSDSVGALCLSARHVPNLTGAKSEGMAGGVEVGLRQSPEKS